MTRCIWRIFSTTTKGGKRKTPNSKPGNGYPDLNAQKIIAPKWLKRKLWAHRQADSQGPTQHAANRNRNPNRKEADGKSKR